MLGLSRRSFLGSAAAAGAAFGLAGCRMGAAARPSPSSRNVFGACRPLADAPLLRDLGYDFIELGVASLLDPMKSDAEAASLLAAAKACPLPVRSCNGFFPAKAWKLTGPAKDWADALKFADVAFRRADEVGVDFIVLGSGGARRAPPDYPVAAAKAEFVEFCKRLADLMEKGSRHVKVVLEPLSPAESNFLNTVTEGVVMVDAVGSPHVRLLADMYHMFSSYESGADIVAAGPRLLHCHVAERSRTMPGVTGTDLSDYFNAFKKIGYTGGFSLECHAPKDGVLRETLARALNVMRRYAG